MHLDLFHQTAGWVWEPSVILGIGLLAAGYFCTVGPARRRWKLGDPVPLSRQLAFYAGCLGLFIALVSPLDALADDSLFSAHMIQHMLLMFVIPPLWLIGLPGWLAEVIIPGQTRKYFAMLVFPVSAFLIFNVSMWLWHIPTLYDGALANESLHVVEHLCFIGAAVIGWWPVLGPTLAGVPKPALEVQAIYLFFNSLSCTALAAIITLSSKLLYPFYGIQPQIYGLTPLADQQLGGVLMWLPGDMILMLFITLTLAKLLEMTGQPKTFVGS
jgi:cytochrome c oxidase assembly factor CtaG